MVERALNDERVDEDRRDILVFNILDSDPAAPIGMLKSIIGSPLTSDNSKQKANEAIKNGNYLENFADPHIRRWQ